MVINTGRGEIPPSITSEFSAGSYDTYRYGLKAGGTLDLGGSDLNSKKTVDANAGGMNNNAASVAGTQMDYPRSANRFTAQGYRDHSGACKNVMNMKLDFDLTSGNRLTLVANHVDLKADDPFGLTRKDFEQSPQPGGTGQREHWCGLCFEIPCFLAGIKREKTWCPAYEALSSVCPAWARS
ncbi:MAG: hypothetical protein H5U29_14375 [Pusillimonas sp.]|nr:hypothetical protein [Pusillimonas sp.]